MNTFKIGDRVRSKADDSSKGHEGVVFKDYGGALYIDFSGDDFEGTYFEERDDGAECVSAWYVEEDNLQLVAPSVAPAPTEDAEMAALDLCVTAFNSTTLPGSHKRMLDYLYARYL